MVAIAYLIPFFFCLLLSVGFHYRGEWTDYLWLVLAGEGLVGLLHYIFYHYRVHTTEYLGSLVRSVYHEAEWTELVPRTVTRRDSRGNTYTTTRIDEVRHPEQYYFDTTRGSRIQSSREFFIYVLGRWGQPPVTDSWTGSRIKGGVRYGSHRHMDFYPDVPVGDDVRWISVTEKHKYKNKIRNSNSIFRFREISKKEAERLNLFKYPEIIDDDAPCILSHNVEVSHHVDEKFRRFNGALAPLNEMRLYILLFDAAETTAAISEYQREYWQGGNKNEFVICLGVDKDNKVDWARVFSWSDRQILEAETVEWFLRNSNLDLDRFYNWFTVNFRKWERKQFSDYKYIGVSLAAWQLLTIILASIAENIGALAIILKDH